MTQFNRQNFPCMKMNRVLIVAFAIMDAYAFEEGADFESKQY